MEVSVMRASETPMNPTTGEAEKALPVPHVCIVVFVMEGCVVCHALVTAFLREFDRRGNLGIDFFLAKKTVEGLETAFNAAKSINPRGYPTVVSFIEGVPALGWEGFISGAEKVDEDELVKFAIQSTIDLVTDPAAPNQRSI
jgi:hypothetical protein